MTKRVFRSVVLVAAAVLIVCLVIISAVLYNHFEDLRREQLGAQTELAAQGIENEGASYLDGLGFNGYRLTWVAADGTVLFDSDANASDMENHAQREEIREALRTGYGESERMSSTLSEKTFYRAERLDDGTVIRMSATQYSVARLMLGMLAPFCVVFVLAILLSAVLARRLSRRIVEPLNKLNLDKPLENEAYEELSPLLLRIERQHRQIEHQMEILRQRQDEFLAVTESMSEGLILLNEQGIVLSINPAAARLYGVGLGCVGRDMLTVDRSLAMQEFIRMAQSGKRGETTLQFAGGDYQVNASPVLSAGKVAGVCLLAFNVTEKEKAERQRMEFSANVSHELKTPLHSIMGSAELIENGLVKPEDMPRFIGQIRSEAARLLTLIEDIIRLSQLDEGGNLQKESVNLKALAEDAIQALSSDAKAKNVALSISGDDARILGVRRLLYEIIFNLCDNAIKYNVENGRVDVTVSETPQGVVLTVSDTGIGIPPAHQARVFERFYRVDKSHSRQTGGTGLGLSIVKHAVSYHGAEMTLESALDKGTTIRIKFPLI